MAKLTNYTYWKKNGEVRVSNSFVEDEQFRKNGWHKTKRANYEAYKRSLAKQQPAPAVASAATPTKAYHYNNGAIVWGNGFAAIKQLVEDCTGAKDAGFLQETLDAIYGIAIYELASKEAQTSVAADVTTWALPSEMVTPEVKAVLERLQASVAPSEATATEIKQSDIIDHVSSELVMLQMAVAEALGLHRHALLDVDRDDIAEMIASLRTALEPFKHEWDTYQNYAKEQDGRADVGNYLTNYRDLDFIMSACRLAATALQASAPPADGESVECCWCWELVEKSTARENEFGRWHCDKCDKQRGIGKYAPADGESEGGG